MSKLNLDKEEIKEALALSQDSVKKNVEIKTKEQLGQDVLYHVALKRFTELVPNVSKRAALSEDNTIPRVHVSKTLRDCIAGYGALVDMVTQHAPIDDNTGKFKKSHKFQADYTGGFYLHAVPFEVCLEPAKKLTADSTGETWLITYNTATRTYPAHVVAKAFITGITYLPKVGDWPDELVTLHIEVTDGKPVRLDDKHHITRGFWEVVLKNYKVTSHRPIEKEAFQRSKQNVADMLSHEDRANPAKTGIPKFLTW